MNRISGRNIYITNLGQVVAAVGGPTAFAARSKDAKFTAVWARLARGATMDGNFALTNIATIRSELKNAGVGLWGWHVPFCADANAARIEATNIVTWADQFSLDGVLVDAERTPDSPRFQGGEAEAKTYLQTLSDGLARNGRGMALSSHDQPSLHTDFPFAVFLNYVADNCPQVYYRSINVATRFNKSVRDYKSLEVTRNFQDRYKPTGNITMTEDVSLPNVSTCLKAAANFIDLVHAGGYHAYSFWCWDSAPNDIWQFFKDIPV
jgi:hypothetical protein